MNSSIEGTIYTHTMFLYIDTIYIPVSSRYFWFSLIYQPEKLIQESTQIGCTVWGHGMFSNDLPTGTTTI